MLMFLYVFRCCLVLLFLLNDSDVLNDVLSYVMLLYACVVVWYV